MPQLFKLDHLIKYKEFFLEVITRQYPLPHDLILKYQPLWKWSHVSINEAIEWDERLLEKCEDKLIWGRSNMSLRANRALPWSVELIEKYIRKGKWQWDDLAFQEKIFEDSRMLAFCLPHWSEKAREKMDSQSPDANWNLGPYEPFKFTKWGKEANEWAPKIIENCPNLDWDLFSGVRGFPWTLEFIEKHQDKFSWGRLSANKEIPWSLEFLEKFKDRLDWFWVNHAWKDTLTDKWIFPYTREILEKFEDYIYWKELSAILDCYEFPIEWTAEMLIRFKDKIHWSEPDNEMGNDYLSLINYEDIYWTLELFQKLQLSIEAHFEKEKNAGENTMEKNKRGESVYWTYYGSGNNWSPELFDFLLKKEKDEGVLTINWSKLAKNAKHLWTKEFIKKHETKIISHITQLCKNEFFPWNDYFDEWSEHLNERGWEVISGNLSLSTSEERIQKYEAKWGFGWGFSSREDLTESLIEEFKDRLDWKSLSYNSAVKLETLFRYPDKIDFDNLCQRKDISEKNLTPEILDRFKDKWNWYRLCGNESIPLSYLYAHFEKLSLRGILERENIKLEDVDLSLPWKWNTTGMHLHNSKKIKNHFNDALVEEFLSEIETGGL